MYVPQIRQLLKEVDGTIRWTPGKTNPADALSRQHLQSPQSHPSAIERINAIPHKKLRFKEFARLKCGRDEFSKLRYAALVERISADDRQKIEAEIQGEAEQAKVIRWMLRG